MALKFLNDGYFAGKVGIGTLSPSTRLHLDQSSNDRAGGLYIERNASNYGLSMFVNSGGYGVIGSNGTFTTDILTLDLNLGNVGIGTGSPTQKLHVAGNLRVTGAYYDSNNAPGTLDQVLTSTATGVTWVDPSTITAEAATLVVIECKNTSGATITKGTPVYQTGTVGATEVIEIAPADALISSGKQPAIGLLQTTLNNNGLGKVVITGEFLNFTTDPIDGVTPTTGDKVFLKSGGGLTLTKPTGAGNGIQNLGLIGKVSSGNAGSITVSSIMRTNDVPNLPTGKIWVGDGNTIVSDTIFLDEPNGRVGIGTTSPSVQLDIEDSNNVIVDMNTTTANANTTIRLQESGSVKATIGYDGTNDGLIITTGGFTAGNGIFIDDSQNVGIGTPTPTSLLHLYKASGDPMLNIQAVSGGDPGITFTSINNRTGDIFYSDGTTNAKLSYDHADTSFKLYAHNTTVADFVLNETTSYFPTQNVGIGTTSPTSQLSIGSNAITTKKPTVIIADEVAGGSLVIRGLSPILSFDRTGANPENKILMDGAGLEFKTGTLDTEGDVDFKIKLDGKLQAPAYTQGFLQSDANGNIEISGGGTLPGGPYLPLAGNTTATAMTGDIFLANTQQVRFLTSGNLVGLRLQSSGTSSFIDNEVGDMYIRQEADGKNIFFQADDGSGGNTTYFSVKPNNGARTQFEKNTRHNDDIKAFFGTGEDLQIYHDGSNSYIKDTGTGDLRIWADSPNISTLSGNKIFYGNNGAAELYHTGGVKKFETTSAGVTVTGGWVTDGVSVATANVEHTDNTKALFGNGNDLEIYHDGSNSFVSDTGTGNLNIQGSIVAIENTSGVNYFVGVDGAQTELYYNGSSKLQTTNTGVAVTGTAKATAIEIESAVPSVLFDETDVTANWRNRVQSGSYRVQYASDGSTFSDYFVLGANANTVAKDTTFAGNVDVNGGQLKIQGDFAKLLFEDTAGTDLDSYIVNNANGLFFGKTNSPSSANDILSLNLSTKAATFAGDVSLTTGNKLIFDGGTDATYISEDIADRLRFFVGGAEFMRFTEDTADTVTIYKDTTFGTQAFATTATSSGDGSSTLTTKGYVDGLITGATIYRGTWDPDVSLNSGYGSPDLSGVTQTSGYYYICSADGAATPNGATTEPNTWNTGDWVIWNDDIGTSGEWQKIDNSSVLSGVGTGQTVALWQGASSVTDSETLGNAPITVSGNNTTFVGSIYANTIYSSTNSSYYIDVVATGLGLNMAGSAAFADNVYISGGQLYLGASDSGTDDSYRMYATSGQFVLASRESGTWTTRFDIDTSGNATFSGNVTIGGKTYPKISLTDNQGVPRTFSVGTSNETFTVRNETASSDAFTISNANNATFAGTIGSGAITSTSTVTGTRLVANGTGNAIELNQSATGSATYYVMDNTVETGGKRYRFGYSGGSSDKGSFSVLNQTDNFMPFIISNTGNVGIGATSPGAKLEVAGGSGAIAGTGLAYFNNSDDAFSLVLNNTGASSQNDRGVFDARVGGSSVFRINNSGNVGIGTTSPAGKLTIADTAFSTAYNSIKGLFFDNSNISSGDGNFGAGIEFGKLSNNGNLYKKAAIIPVQSGGDSDQMGISFFVSNSTSQALPVIEAMRVEHGGNVGIGNTNPSDYSADANNLVVGSLSGNNGITILSSAASGYGSLYFADASTGNKVYSGYIRYQQNQSNMTFGTNEVERMRIDLNGNVGIGTTSPDAKLEVAGGSTGILLSNLGDSSAYDAVAMTYSGYNSGTPEFIFQPKTAPGSGTVNSWFRFKTQGTSGVNIANVTVDGSVGIGVTDPDAKLEIKASGSTTGLTFKTTDSAGNENFFIQDGGRTGVRYYPFTIGQASGTSPATGARFQVSTTANDFVVLNDSSTGIGTITPQSKLQVAGGIQMADDTATASAAKVGTMRYRTGTEYVEDTGIQLLLNNNFDTDTVWAKGTGWAISGGKANATASTDYLSQNPYNPVASAYYQITWTISNYTAGTYRFYMRGGVSADFGTSTYIGNGTFTHVMQAGGGGANGFLFDARNALTASIDNIMLTAVSVEQASYADMCMQTGASTYEWVNIVRNTY